MEKRVRLYLVVVLMLPLAILFSFLLMKIFGIPSNIMSLAGIAISVGILEDQATIAAATLQATRRPPRDVATKEAGQTERQRALARSARTEDQQDLARREVDVDVLDRRSLGPGEAKDVSLGVDRGRRQGVASGSAPDRRTARSMATAASGRTMAPEIAIAMAMASRASGAYSR
jgi:hypothetical protein